VQVGSKGGGLGGEALLFLQGRVQNALQLRHPRFSRRRLTLNRVQLCGRLLPPGSASLGICGLCLRRIKLGPEILDRSPKPRLGAEEAASLPSKLLGPLRERTNQ